VSSTGASRSETEREYVSSSSSSGRAVSLSPVEPTWFDEYLLVGRLGHGGMAEVSLGLKLGPAQFRKLVAIKRLHVHLEEDAELVRMFEYEASVAALLSHPSIPQAYKTGCVGGRHFIAMEYVEGQPLHRVLARLREAGAIDPALAARIVYDALEGLEHAHSARDYEGTPLGIVHRDVSPHNLLVGYDGHVRVLDFGIAKADNRATYTQPGFIRGKLAYVAPELATGHVDATSDLWSIGVILWEALAGRRLFTGADDAAVLRAVLSAPIPSLLEVAPAVPIALAELVQRALSRDRAERPRSAGEFARALAGWIERDGGGFTRMPLMRAMEQQFGGELAARREAIRAVCAEADFLQRGRDTGTTSLGALGSAAQTAHTPAPRTLKRPPARPARTFALALAGVLVAGGLAWLTPRSDVALLSTAPRLAAAALVRQADVVAAERAVLPAASPRGELLRPEANMAELRERPSALSLELSAQRSRLEAREAWRARRAQALLPATPSPEPLKPVAPRVATGHLQLEATPYAIITLGGQRLGVTPIEVDLPEGPHVLTLRNPERGIETTYRVRVVAGERTSRRVELE
jgi:eukaryotic-like serine/threonine-protein kinase